MPKMKSVSGAKKRFKVKKNGQIKRGSAFRSHILTKMSQKRKRNLRKSQSVHASNASAVKKMLCLN
jgi:large subunit ribosomal protein L35